MQKDSLVGELLTSEVMVFGCGLEGELSLVKTLLQVFYRSVLASNFNLGKIRLLRVVAKFSHNSDWLPAEKLCTLNCNPEKPINEKRRN